MRLSGSGAPPLCPRPIPRRSPPFLQCVVVSLAVVTVVAGVFDGGMADVKHVHAAVHNRTVERSTSASSSASPDHFGARTTEELKKSYC